MIYNVPLEYQQDSLREPKQVTSVSVNSLGQLSRVFISDCCQNLQNLATTQHFNICNTAVHGGPKNGPFLESSSTYDHVQIEVSEARLVFWLFPHLNVIVHV